MLFLKQKRGITLVETLVAITIFGVLASVAVGILVSIVNLEKRIAVQDIIYEDLRVTLSQITDEIQNGAIDYGEYYNYYVAQKGETSDKVFYGTNPGVYGSRFYDPGQSLNGGATKNPKDLGVECSWPNPLPAGTVCDVEYTLSVDLNTGQNPFTGVATVSNAFTDHGIGQMGTPVYPHPVGTSDHLFLIDNTGTKKTIVSTKKTATKDYAVGLVRMKGLDIDQNGIVDLFTCYDEFNCYGDGVGEADVVKSTIKTPVALDGVTLPQKSDLDLIFDPPTSQFVPVSPLRSSVKNLDFIIYPLEDPYQAYAEGATQIHPYVTIFLTLGLSEEAQKNYPGVFEDITVQTTVATGVVGKIDSYPPVNVTRDKTKNSWINDVIPELSSPY